MLWGPLRDFVIFLRHSNVALKKKKGPSFVSEEMLYGLWGLVDKWFESGNKHIVLAVVKREMQYTANVLHYKLTRTLFLKVNNKNVR